MPSVFLAVVKALSSRDYRSKLGGGVDLVVLFLPGDSFLTAGLETDRSLIEDALRAGVIVSTPGTLLALLRSVALSWQQKSIAENSARIAGTARELYERTSTFFEPLQKLGKQLDAAVDAYNQAAGSYQRGILPFARKLEELGAADLAKKDIPELPQIDVQIRELRAGA